MLRNMTLAKSMATTCVSVDSSTEERGLNHHWDSTMGDWEETGLLNWRF